MKAPLPHSRLRAKLGLSLALVVVGARAQLPGIPEDVKETVRQRVEYGYCPGVVIGLMNTNGAAYFSQGSVDLDGGPAVDADTLFEIGSITKVFTTTLLADMAQRGELELTNAIQAYLPEGIQAPTRSGRAITLTHLATHTSGLPSAPGNLEVIDGSNPFASYTLARAFEFLDSYTLTRLPGSTYEGCNGVKYRFLTSGWRLREFRGKARKWHVLVVVGPVAQVVVGGHRREAIFRPDVDRGRFPGWCGSSRDPAAHGASGDGVPCTTILSIVDY